MSLLTSLPPDCPQLRKSQHSTTSVYVGSWRRPWDQEEIDLGIPGGSFVKGGKEEILKVRSQGPLVILKQFQDFSSPRMLKEAFWTPCEQELQAVSQMDLHGSCRVFVRKLHKIVSQASSQVGTWLRRYLLLILLAWP